MKSKNIELEHIHPSQGRSMRLLHQRNTHPCSIRSWHYHPEIELVFIPEGKGKLYIAETVKAYDNGIVVLLHSNIPHRCFDFGFEGEVYTEYVIQILPQQLEPVLKNFPEFDKVNQLIEAARQGVVLPLQEEHIYLRRLFEKMEQSSPIGQLLIFLDVLHHVSKEAYQGISTTFSVEIAPLGIERIEKVFNYISTHFMNNISSQDAARLIHLTDTSFCRFFQKHTNKTFKQVLNEYRLMYACRLLAHSDKSIETIAYEAGYGSVSFFNRMFKRTNGVTPLHYRKNWL
jgi:AraC-like DNA-binding protein